MVSLRPLQANYWPQFPAYLLGRPIPVDSQFCVQLIFRYSIQVYTASELSDVDQANIWDIFEQNMRHLYALPTCGHQPPLKRLAGIPSLPWDGIHRQKRRSCSIVTLASFFSDVLRPRVVSNTSTRSYPFWPTQCSVLTWKMMNVFCIGMVGFHTSLGTHLLCSYELQVSQSVQRGGMGKTLMGCLYDIARRWNMRKVMLTVFKGENVSAPLELSCTQSLFGREPSCILILQGNGVGTLFSLICAKR
jgi:hypothetical protein